ncbi:MAG: NAD(P)H-dependent oxidoreductase [Minicystis sp.]
MAVVLDVNVLPRGETSRTRKLRDAFMRAFFAKHPESQRINVDLADIHGKLPAFDEWDISAKFEMLYGEGRLDEAQAARWDALSVLTDQLHTADLVVISAPMWNFGVPWHLKRWLDCVVQGRLTFEYRDGGFHGLLKGREAVILTTRDGAYPPGTPEAALDFQVPYLKTILGLIGLGPIHTVIAEPMALGGPEVAAAALEAAVESATALGASL